VSQYIEENRYSGGLYDTIRYPYRNDIISYDKAYIKLIRAGLNLYDTVMA